jgi:hypothetical protein
VGISCTQHLVTFNLGIDDLQGTEMVTTTSSHPSVGKPHHSRDADTITLGSGEGGSSKKGEAFLKPLEIKFNRTLNPFPQDSIMG